MPGIDPASGNGASRYARSFATRGKSSRSASTIASSVAGGDPSGRSSNQASACPSASSSSATSIAERSSPFHSSGARFSPAIRAKPGFVEAAVAASSATERRLQAAGIDVLDLNMAGELALYVDGADEADASLALVKGGGAALTREKIVAGASREFVCMVDASKRVPRLGSFGVPLEVIPMARSFVARRIVDLGADPEYREGVRTDNGCVILDCYGFDIEDPGALETRLNAIPGVVTNGLFAARRADVLLVGHDDGSVETLRPPGES